MTTRTPISSADETRHVNKLDEAYADFEEKVRRKALTLVKEKIEQRLKDVEIDAKAVSELEKEFWKILRIPFKRNSRNTETRILLMPSWYLVPATACHS